VVISAAEYGDELEQLIETVEVEAFCGSCGVRAVAPGRRPAWVRDLAFGNSWAYVHLTATSNPTQAGSS